MFDSIANNPELNQALLGALKSQFPGLKNQAQFNAVMGAFDAFRAQINNILEGKSTEQSLSTLEKAYEAIRLATEITEKYEAVPEAQGPNAAPFVTPPKEFHEYDEVKSLLAELESIDEINTLTTWYEQTKNRRAKVVSQNLRNSLLDTIRAKKLALTPKSES